MLNLRDLERLATAKRMTLGSLIQSASMDYLRREVMGMTSDGTRRTYLSSITEADENNEYKETSNT
jgi:hypothetical protein